uniref:Superoxide dismutase Feic isoform X3 n=1 Tax=Rhizophora mucronata TaxID=61149 RepID=A0A2P2K466_RHIMU
MGRDLPHCQHQAYLLCILAKPIQNQTG